MYRLCYLLAFFSTLNVKMKRREQSGLRAVCREKISFCIVKG